MKSMRRYIARTVLVTTPAGHSFSGTLEAADADTVTLDRVTAIKGGVQNELGGVVIIATGPGTTAQVI